MPLSDLHWLLVTITSTNSPSKMLLPKVSKVWNTKLERMGWRENQQRNLNKFGSKSRFSQQNPTENSDICLTNVTQDRGHALPSWKHARPGLVLWFIFSGNGGIPSHFRKKSRDIPEKSRETHQPWQHGQLGCWKQRLPMMVVPFISAIPLVFPQHLVWLGWFVV